MTLLREIVAELVGMFLGDARLTAGLAAIVAATALIQHAWPGHSLGAAALLVAGSLAILVAAVVLAARKHRAAERGAAPAQRR